MQMLSALTALSLATPPPPSRCNIAQIQAILKCYKPWIEAYGLVMPSPTTLPPYSDFHDVRVSWFTGQGSANQQKVCDLGNTLITCLKPHWSCINNEMYESMGQNTVFAYTYHSDLYVTQFQCSERGLQMLLPSFECVDEYRINGGAEEQGVCAQNIDNYIMQEGGDQCKGLNKFLACMYDVYFPKCGDNGGRFICESNRAAARAQVTWCGTTAAYEFLQCPIPRQPQKLVGEEPSAAMTTILKLPMLLLSLYIVI